MALGMAVPLRNARADAITTFAGTSALLRIYAGTRPATGGTATTLLSEHTCSASLAAAAASGVLTLNAVSTVNAVATGTAAWFRLVKSDGTTHIMDGSIGVSGSDMNMVTTSITSGQPVQVSGSYTEGNP